MTTEDREAKLMAVVVSAINILDGAEKNNNDDLTEAEIRAVGKALAAGRVLISIWEAEGTHKEDLAVLKQFATEAEALFKEEFFPSSQVH